MSYSLIANMRSFINTSNSFVFKWNVIYIATFRIAFGILDMINLHSSMQGEDIFEQTSSKCDVFTFKDARGRYSQA